MEVRVVGPFGQTPTKIWALVDSGAEHTYGGPWLPQTVGVNPHPDTEITVGIGGGSRRVRFADVGLRLLSPEGDEYLDWNAEVGFFQKWEPGWAVLLGQRGFFSQFTVTMNHAAKSFAIESWDAFDRHFGDGP